MAVKRYLLDTHLIYWWMTADTRLGETSERLISESEILVSTASLWEMTLKNAKGKLPLPPGSLSEQFHAQGFMLLPILPRHIEATRHLNSTHTDPFDLLLVAQARDERLTLLTRDAAILGMGLEGVEKG